MVFGFKGVKGDDFKEQIEQGASDQEMVEWLNQNGEKKTPEEIERWADEVEASSLYNHPETEKRDYFSEETKKLGLDPSKTTTFEWLEIDDRVSHAQQAASFTLPTSRKISEVLATLLWSVSVLKGTAHRAVATRFLELRLDQR